MEYLCEWFYSPQNTPPFLLSLSTLVYFVRFVLSGSYASPLRDPGRLQSGISVKITLAVIPTLFYAINKKD